MSETTSESIGEKMTTILDTTNTPDTSNTINTSYSIDNILSNMIIEEEEGPSGVETDIPKGNRDLPEEATPVVPKASLPSISNEEPSYSSSSSTGMSTEKQILLEECLNSFIKSYGYTIDIQLLQDNQDQFLEKYYVKISALSQQILFKVHREIPKTSIVMYLKDYVEKHGITQDHEKT